MTTHVSLVARGGGAVEGELAEPSGSGKAPALVLIQEWWGINDHIRDLAARLSNDGFLVLAPDLFHGRVTKDSGEAARLMNELDTVKALDEIAGAAAFLKAHPRSNGKVGAIGFCMGGALSLASACHVSDLSAVVAFYGIPPAEKADYSKVTAPIMMHVGSKDAWITPARAEEVKQKVEAHGSSLELHVYEADHAFANDTRPEVHNPEATKLAWKRTVAFFEKHLI